MHPAKVNATDRSPCASEPSVATAVAASRRATPPRHAPSPSPIRKNHIVAAASAALGDTIATTLSRHSPEYWADIFGDYGG